MPKNFHLFLKGTVGYWSFNADMVNYILDKHKDEEVHVLIDSLGGYTADAVSISSLFKLHGNVHVHFVGHNASAATIAAMGAKHISIDEDAAFLVHKCLSPIMEWAYMNADDLDEHIKKLEGIKKDNETIDSCVAGMYARRCKKSKEELLSLMKVGGWLTPEQALEWGFVDEITRYKEDKKEPLSAAAISSLSDAGIPLPPDVKRQKGSILDRFIAFLQTPFSNQAPDAAAQEAASHSPFMAKLTALCALLGATLELSADKQLTLSEDQAATVNDKLEDLNSALAEKDTTIADLQAKIAERDTTIAELQKKPADTTSEVVDDKKGEVDPYAPVSAAEAIEASKAFLGLR